MSEFQTVRGFEDIWRPARWSSPPRAEAVVNPVRHSELRDRLMRLVSGAPEVVVKAGARTRDLPQLKAHFEYISRGGALAVEDRDGNLLRGRANLHDLADDWSAAAQIDARRCSDTPLSRSIVLSMPEATDAIAVLDATRSFGREILAERFAYVFVLHIDTARPHAHLAVRVLGDEGSRFNPWIDEFALWRERFAQALRDRGVMAEATSRRARGVTRKAERLVLRKMREAHEAGQGAAVEVHRSAFRDAALCAFGADTQTRPWEALVLRTQTQVRGLYLAQARVLEASREPRDQTLGRKLKEFVCAMPAPDTRRLALARELRAANTLLKERADIARNAPIAAKDRGRER